MLSVDCELSQQLSGTEFAVSEASGLILARTY